MTRLHPDDLAPGGPIPAYVPEHAAPVDVLTDQVVQAALTELRRTLTEHVIVELQLREHLVYREHLDWWQRAQWASVGAAGALVAGLVVLLVVWGLS